MPKSKFSIETLLRIIVVTNDRLTCNENKVCHDDFEIGIYAFVITMCLFNLTSPKQIIFLLQ